MIIDARRDPPRSTIVCDLCIVGSGAAGMTLALRLDDARRSICVLESGGTALDSRAQSLLAGEPGAGDYPPLHTTRVAALGGSTNVWAGWCRPLDAIDLDQRADVPGSGWPIARADLDPFYTQAHDVLGLGAFDYDPETWSASSGSPRLAVDEHVIATVLFRRSGVRFGRRYADAMRRSANIRLYLYASVLRLVFSEGGTHVESVEVATLTSKRFAVRPRTLVLAAGGIENARLLLLSGSLGRGCGPGNERGLVGRYFTDHGYVDSALFVPAACRSLVLYFPRSVGKGETTRTARGACSPVPAVMRREHLLNCAIFFRPAYEARREFESPRLQSLLSVWDMYRGRAIPHDVLRKLAHGGGAPFTSLRALWHRWRDRADASGCWRMRSLFECGVERDHRIELGTERDAFDQPVARVQWDWLDNDLRSVMRAHELLDGALRAAGLGELTLLGNDPAAWRSKAQPGLHHLCTTRMHDDPSRGVVDRNGQAHGVDNLFIAGGSTFTTGGFANPTLTIIALTLRLAAHLEGRG